MAGWVDEEERLDVGRAEAISLRRKLVDPVKHDGCLVFDQQIPDAPPRIKKFVF